MGLPDNCTRHAYKFGEVANIQEDLPCPGCDTRTAIQVTYADNSTLFHCRFCGGLSYNDKPVWFPAQKDSDGRALSYLMTGVISFATGFGMATFVAVVG